MDHLPEALEGQRLHPWQLPTSIASCTFDVVCWLPSPVPSLGGQVSSANLKPPYPICSAIRDHAHSANCLANRYPHGRGNPRVL